MTISYPLDILADFPGWSTSFELMWRQEQSRTAGGVTYVKDMGTPLWRATYQSRIMRPNELDLWRAKLDALENGLQTFKGCALSRCYPIAYPNGTWPTGGSFSGTTAKVKSVADGKKLAIEDLPAGFVLSVGDMVQITHGSDPVRNDLYRVMEAVTADGDGDTAAVEVRPHFWTGVAAGNAVSVRKPWCLMAVIPGSVSAQADMSTGNGSVSFQAIEARE